MVALLAGLALPALNKSTKEARGSVCIGNMRQIGQALLNFRTDSGGLIVPSAEAGQDYHPEVVLEAYMGSANGTAVQSRVWSCPANPALPLASPPGGYDGRGLSYAVNASLTGLTAGQLSREASLFLALERNTGKADALGTSVNRDTYYVYRGGYYDHPLGNAVVFADGHIKPLYARHPALEGTVTTGTAWIPFWTPN